ncbi:MAG: hypothetical protein R3B72_36845 [Polyangiaceae bacterium]
MSLRHHRTHLLTAIFAALLTSAPAAAFAQDDDDDDTAAEGGEGSDEGEGEGEGEGGDAIPPPPPDDGESTTGGWGVGGDEPEGKYKPSGKTGKLKELEEDEEEEKEDTSADAPPDMPPPGWVNVDTLLGIGDALVVRNEGGPTKITPTAAFVIGFGYRIADMWEIYARFPVMTGKSNGPAEPFVPEARDPDQYKQISTGNLELGFRPWFGISRDLVIPVGLSLALPTSQGDMFATPDERAKLGKRAVNVASAAASGFLDRAIFASKRFGITPSGGVRYQIRDVGPGKIQLQADTKIEIMPKTGGTDPLPAEQLPPDETPGELKAVAVNWVIGGGAGYSLWDGLFRPGLNLWLSVSTPDEVVGTIDNGGAQFVFEPNLATHIDFTGDQSFGMDVRAGFILPAGGQLGGAAPSEGQVYGFRIGAGFFF